ncbi:unnamed protein product [Fraxinus pennsylvanica]|uniref:Uncharacterized protein n=1 Tax=Fraxinus pennsylvanica TaxID=56036 RepID=A0AAD1Z930_9LAMI|nr:unnamed protein product [Fraxinus pennsylvanica]
MSGLVDGLWCLRRFVVVVNVGGGECGYFSRIGKGGVGEEEEGDQLFQIKAEGAWVRWWTSENVGKGESVGSGGEVPTVRSRPNSRFLTATVVGVQQANRAVEFEKKLDVYSTDLDPARFY